MKNSYFTFKQFTVRQDRCAMKVCTDACLFGAWLAEKTGELALDTKHMLDIGTGTGLLSLMMAQKKNAFIDAIETDGHAYGQAVQNVHDSPWSNQIQVIHGDATTHLFNTPYDLILSNPPFYEKDLYSLDDSRNKARHGSGFTLLQLLKVTVANLAGNGSFAVLLPYSRTAYFQALATAVNLHLHVSVRVKHSLHHPWSRSFLLFGRAAAEPQQQEMIITDANGYTTAFSRLLQDYYLHL